MPPPMVQVVIVPPQNVLTDQLPFLPGFEQIQAGQPLTAETFRLFRNCIFKTILIYREKRHARFLLITLSTNDKVKKWVHSFAPFSSSLTEAFLPLVKIVCLSFGWPHAELWRLSDTPGARNITVLTSFSFVYNRWTVVEGLLSKLATHMKARTITLPSRELPGDVFTAHKMYWQTECIESCPDPTRAKLMEDAFIKSAFAIPLRDEHSDTVSHALVFYGDKPHGFTATGSRRFLEFAVRYINECYGKVEVICEDEEDERKDEVDATRVLIPGVAGEPYRKQARHSRSLVHNVAGPRREF